MSAGRRELNVAEAAWFRFKSGCRRALVSEIAVRDGAFKTIFVCESRLEASRAMSLWVKEAGTMAWIDTNVRPGERFLDIGANIGIYTLAAAHRVGAAGTVYAVEPHKPNAVALMRNVIRNALEARVEMLAIPLAARPSVGKFHYKTLGPATTGSQLDKTEVVGKPFTAAASEIVLSTSVDELIAAAAIQAPHHIKIDVDGIELAILQGMTQLLTSPQRPRSLQVELNVGEHEAVEAFMAANNYRLDHRHFTLIGKRQLKAGKSQAEIAHNAVFTSA